MIVQAVMMDNSHSENHQNDLESSQLKERRTLSSNSTGASNSAGNHTPSTPEENENSSNSHATHDSNKAPQPMISDEHQMMVYPLWYYYAILFVDTILRFLWVPLSFSATYTSSLFYMYAILEVIRRVSWNFFRVEIEHVHNCIAKRVIDTGSCPLPFITQELYEPPPVVLAPPTSPNPLSRSSSRRDLGEDLSSRKNSKSTQSVVTLRGLLQSSRTPSVASEYPPAALMDDEDEELIYRPHQTSRTISTASQSALNAINLVNTIFTEHHN